MSKSVSIRGPLFDRYKEKLASRGLKMSTITEKLITDFLDKVPGKSKVLVVKSKK